MKTSRAILVGAGIWALAVSLYTLSYQVRILDDPDQQANLVLSVVVIPLVWLGSRLYYKKDSAAHGLKVGGVFLLTAALLDAAITVPLFIIPIGGNHYSFFTDPGFWAIAGEMVGTTVLYYALVASRRKRTLKA